MREKLLKRKEQLLQRARSVEAAQAQAQAQAQAEQAAQATASAKAVPPVSAGEGGARSTRESPRSSVREGMPA
jgi:hypothetical protein